MTCQLHGHETPESLSLGSLMGLAAFLTDGQILAGMNHLAGIPVVLIHGRHELSFALDSFAGPAA